MAEEVAVGVDGAPWTPTATFVDGRSPSAPLCRGGRAEAGAVTAEAAMVLPVLVAIALGLVWTVALAAAHVRAVDGAREVARLAARGEGVSKAVAHGRRVAPEGSRFTIARGDEQVRVTVVADIEGPGGLFGFVPSVAVRAEAVAAAEPR